MVYWWADPEDGSTDLSHAWARDAIKLEQLKARPKVGRAQGLVSTNTDLVLIPGKPRSITLILSIQCLFKYFVHLCSTSCMEL